MISVTSPTSNPITDLIVEVDAGLLVVTVVEIATTVVVVLVTAFGVTSMVVVVFDPEVGPGRAVVA